MKTCVNVSKCRLKSDEVYLFNTSEWSCPPVGSLWGMVSAVGEGAVCLESSSRDLREFRLWHSLPPEYCYSRLATRRELRDYMYQLACWESSRQR